VSTKFIKSLNIDFYVATLGSRKLLLVLASTVTLVCGTRGTHDHIFFCLTSLRIVQLTSSVVIGGQTDRRGAFMLFFSC
jgi:hypothetical protein